MSVANISNPLAVNPKPFAKAHFIRHADTRIRRPRAASQPYGPGTICKSYGLPTGIEVVPLKIVILELDGVVYSSDLAPWAKAGGFPTPNVVSHNLPGASPSAGDADAEVALDWQRAAEWYSYMTGLPAQIEIINGPNTGTAFSQVVTYANTLPGVGAGSESWGAPSTQWAAADRTAYDDAVQASPFPWSAASGDNDADDGTGSPVVDYPAESPFNIGCGGTSFPLTGAEVVWNNGQGEGTGGGFSKNYPTPAWQPANSQGTGRMVPDLAANADPDTGYNTLINGQWQVIGGTSAVAPMIAGFMCVVNGARLKANLPMLGVSNKLLWSLSNCFFDVRNGNNGQYSATEGPDPCSGLGRPLGMLFQALVGGQNPPPPPPPAWQEVFKFTPVTQVNPGQSLVVPNVPSTIYAGGQYAVYHKKPPTP